nr:MAG TPA: hypothetical protein [Caudoviricetes sp.]
MAVNYGQVAIVPKGVWNAETQYKVNNLVEYDGSSYVAKVQPPVGTLPTDTSYWQVSAAGTKKATADSLGTVMPDGTTTEIKEDGKLSAKTAQQNALGIVKGSDDINVGEDGTMTVNTTFEQATELANIIAGEAIKSVLGKVSKAIATTMSLDENALLKNMISGIDVNDSNKVPSSAYIHTLVERIGMGTELDSGLGDLTTGLNTVNNNLSNFQSENAKLSIGRVDEGPYMYLINKITNSLLMMRMNENDKSISVNAQVKGTWGSEKKLATKDDLGVFLTASGTKASVFNGYVEITNLKLYAGHTYLILGKTGSSISVSLISARIVSPSSEYGSAFNFLESRTTGSNGGGCVTAAIITLAKDYTVPLQGYGYDNATYDYQGFLMAIQLK